MELEIGERYLTRDGKVITLIAHVPEAETYKYVGKDVEGNVWTYTDSGEYIFRNKEGRFDLVLKHVETWDVAVYLVTLITQYKEQLLFHYRTQAEADSQVRRLKGDPGITFVAVNLITYKAESI